MVYNSCIQGFCFDVFASSLAEAWMRDSDAYSSFEFFNEFSKADSSPALLFIPTHVFVERVGGCYARPSESGAHKYSY